MILKQLITEKTSLHQEKSNIYTFLVKPVYNKIEIKNFLSSFFSIDIAKIRTLNLKSKQKSIFKKKKMITGKTSKFKKVIIQLPKNQKINNEFKIK